MKTMIWIFLAELMLFRPVWAQSEPNDNYSSMVVSYQRSNFAAPLCINNECHEGVSGPALVYSNQLVPNLAMGVSGAYLQSSGRVSSVRSTSLSGFVQAIAGFGRQFDAGISFAVLGSSLQSCNTVSSICNSFDDYGNDVGIFGKAFLTESRNVSLTLSYDSVLLHESPNHSVVALSLVSLVAKQHRFNLYVSRTYDSSNVPLSSSAGLGYSYRVF